MKDAVKSCIMRYSLFKGLTDTMAQNEKNVVYLDNAATTRTDPEVIAEITDTLLNCFGNPSSLHRLGLSAELKMEKAAKQIAHALGASPKELLFTSGGTEANNLAVFGAALAREKRGKKIITTAFEHSSVLQPFLQLKERGFETETVSPEKDGSFDIEKILEKVDENTTLVSCMMVNNELGTVCPIERLVKEVKRKNPQTVVHCDAVQAFGKLPFSVSKLGVDLCTVSGHKIHGPKGIGALYIRQKTKLKPLFYGGLQQQGLRPGTENVAYLAGFGLACEKTEQKINENITNVSQLNAILRNELSHREKTVINSPEDASPYLLNFSVPGYRSEVLLHFLEEKGVYVSSGSACSKGHKSHVLESVGLDAGRIDSALRIGLCDTTTEEEIYIFLQALDEAVLALRRLR